MPGLGNSFIRPMASFINRLTAADSHEALRQADVVEADRFGKKRGDFAVPEPGDAAADAGDIEEAVRMRLGESDEIIHIGLDRLHATLHGRDGVALALKAHTASPDGSELEVCRPGGPAAMHAGQVAAEDKDLIAPQFRDMLRRECRAFDSVVCAHNDANLAKERTVL